MCKNKRYSLQSLLGYNSSLYKTWYAKFINEYDEIYNLIERSLPLNFQVHHCMILRIWSFLESYLYFFYLSDSLWYPKTQYINVS